VRRSGGFKTGSTRYSRQRQCIAGKPVRHGRRRCDAGARTPKSKRSTRRHYARHSDRGVSSHPWGHAAVETTLKRGEIITASPCRPPPNRQRRSIAKVRDRGIIRFATGFRSAADRGLRRRKSPASGVSRLAALSKPWRVASAAERAAGARRAKGTFETCLASTFLDGERVLLWRGNEFKYPIARAR